MWQNKKDYTLAEEVRIEEQVQELLEQVLLEPKIAD